MKITDIRTIPLFGETPMTGWTIEPGPDENMHTLVEVQIGTDLCPNFYRIEY